MQIEKHSTPIFFCHGCSFILLEQQDSKIDIIEEKESGATTKRLQEILVEKPSILTIVQDSKRDAFP